MNDKEQLLHYIQTKCESKAAFARSIGYSRQQVDNWLKGNTKPIPKLVMDRVRGA